MKRIVTSCGPSSGEPERQLWVDLPFATTPTNGRSLRIAAGLAHCEEGERPRRGLLPAQNPSRFVPIAPSCGNRKLCSVALYGITVSPRSATGPASPATRGAFPPLTCLAVLARPLFSAPSAVFAALMLAFAFG